MVNAWYIFQKDLQQEYRTRYALNAILLFAVVTLSAVSFAIGTYSVSQETLSALLWIILFFSSMSGLAHIFVREEETHTAETLRLVATPTSIFLGKLLFNIILLFMLEIIIIPLFIGVMNLQVQNYLLFYLTLVIGSIGLAGGGTIVGAIISKASSKGALFTVLAFPILLPVLISGISATKKAVTQPLLAEAYGELQAIIAYAIVIITASILLFDFIWDE